MSQTQGTSTLNMIGAVSLAATALVAVSCSAGSSVGVGAAAVTTATASIEIVIQEVDAQDHQPVPKAWVRILGGTHNVPYRSRRTASES